MHILYHIDTPSLPYGFKRADEITGWCVCTDLIAAFKVKAKGGGFMDSTYGQPRPDIEKYYGQYPDAKYSGFTISLPNDVNDFVLEFDLSITTSGTTRHFCVPLNLKANITQHIDLDEGPYISSPAAAAAEEKLRKHLRGRRGITVWLDIINKCNLRCIMCHYSDVNITARQTKKLTAGDFKLFLRDIHPYISFIMLSCADEPLLSDQLPEILLYLSETYPDIEIGLCTNAVLMDAHIRNLIIEAGVTRIRFSIDGVTKKTYERIRKKSNYETVLGNIIALRDLKRRTAAKFPLFIMNYVMMDLNIHEAPLFVRLCSELEAHSIVFLHVSLSRYFNDASQSLIHHKAKFNYYRQKIMEEANCHHIDIVMPPEFDTAEKWRPQKFISVDLKDYNAVVPDRQKGHMPAPKAFSDAFIPEDTTDIAAELFPKAYCPKPFSEIIIADQEFIKPCPFYKKNIGTLKSGGSLYEIFFGEEFKKVRGRMFNEEIDENCADCPVKASLLP